MTIGSTKQRRHNTNKAKNEQIEQIWNILLIDYCLTSSEQYFSYVQDENEFNNILNSDNKEGVIGHCENMESCIRTKCLAYCSSYSLLNLQEVFKVHGVLHFPNTLPNMVHGQVFRIVNWDPRRRAPPIHHHGTHWTALWIWALLTFTGTQLNLTRSSCQLLLSWLTFL